MACGDSAIHAEDWAMISAVTGRDVAYENGGFIPGAASYSAGWERQAYAFRKQVRCELDLSYGAHAREAYDLFLPEHAPKGLMIFVHGGYWKARSKSDWSGFAAGALGQGFACAMIGYPLAPEVRISDITRSVSQGVAAASSRVAGPLILTGHSAGGHLVARMAMPGSLPERVAARVQRVMPISPVSDLRPLRALSMNRELGLDAEEAEAESPILGCKHDHISVVSVVGAQERAAFLEQNRWLAEAWQIPQVILPGRHHFDVIDDLADPGSAMMGWLAG